MTDGKLQTYRAYDRFVRKMILYGGCLHNPTVTRTYTYCVTLLAIFACGLQTLCLFIFSYYYRHNLAVMVKTLSQSTATFGVVLKICWLFLNRNYLMKFDRKLHDLFEEELARNEQTRTLILSGLNEFCIPTYIYSIAMSATLLVYLFPVFINIIRQLIHLEIPSRYGLPYGTRYPWPVPDGLIYHVHFLWEICCIWFLLFTICGVDGLFGLYAYQMSAVLRVMAFRLANPLTGENVTHLLRTCVEKHKQLLQCRRDLERVFGPIIIWPLLVNAIILCSLVYEALPISDFTFGKFMMFSSYMTLKLVQTFMYTWYGTVITSASEDFRQGIYCSKSPDALDKRNLKTTMILTLMQESITVRALKICSASVEAFTNVMNTAISYFFLLQTKQKR